MRSLNELTRYIKTAATSQLVVNTAITGESFEREDHDLYPLVHIVPGAWRISGNLIINKFAIIILDLGSEDGTHRAENLSDTQLVGADIVTKLIKDSADLTSQAMSWEMIGEATKVVDAEGDNSTGWILELEVSQTYDKNNCILPV